MTKLTAAITGAGVVAPTGADVSQFWEGLISGQAAFRPAEHFSTVGCAAPVIGYAAVDWPYDPLRRLGQLVASAAEQALADGAVGDRSGVVLVFGTTSNGTGRIADPGAPQIDPPVAASMARAFSRRLGLHPASLCLSNASASGATVIGAASELLACGDAAQVLAVAADLVTPQAYFGLSSIRALSPAGCQPFSRGRRGIRPSEAAGALLLEAPDSERRRGVRPRAYVRGYGASGMADNPARPGAISIAKAVREALAEAAVPAAAVTYVNCHGPGTKVGDEAELDALRDVFGDRLPQVAINSSKPLLGHTQGAAGLVEALVTMLAVQHGCLPPTHGLVDVDSPWAELDVCAVRPRVADVQHALSISCGLGGLNTALLLARQAQEAA